MDLAHAALAGDRRALARLLTEIENGSPAGRQALRALFRHTGRAHLIGITGAPGTGKSTLVAQLARYYRKPPQGSPRRVAVVAVDPTSPFTGGAILGDRIRMRDLAGDPGVFVRSMASRGATGGLAQTTGAMVQALDAVGYDIVLIETVGAGQAEIEVARLAHTVVVVEAPGLGDDIQAIKAGLLEIADIFVVNKADRPGADATARALEEMLNLAHPTTREIAHHGLPAQFPASGGTLSSPQPWTPPVLKTIALQGQGIEALAQALEQHRTHLQASGEWQRREQQRLQRELENRLQRALLARWRAQVPTERYQTVMQAVLERRLAPDEAVERLLNGIPSPTQETDHALR